MYLGHLAPPLALSSFFPSIPPSALLFGVSLLDLVNGVLTITGFNRVTPDPYPGGLPYMFFKLDFIDWDHSLLSAGVLSLAWGGWWGWKTKRDQKMVREKGESSSNNSSNSSPMTVGLVAGAAVFSHWIEDWLVHNGDLALYPYSETHFGCGLWGKMGISAWALEGALCVPFVWYAWRRYDARGAKGCMKFPALAMVGLWATVSPWGSLLRFLAETEMVGEKMKGKLMGGTELASFLIPVLVLGRWMEEANGKVKDWEKREQRGKRVD